MRALAWLVATSWLWYVAFAIAFPRLDARFLAWVNRSADGKGEDA